MARSFSSTSRREQLYRTAFCAISRAGTATDGYVYDPDGVNTQEKYDFMVQMRYHMGQDRVEPSAEDQPLYPPAGQSPWAIIAWAIFWKAAMLNTQEKYDFMVQMRYHMGQDRVEPYAEKFGALSSRRSEPLGHHSLRDLLEGGDVVAGNKVVAQARRGIFSPDKANFRRHTVVWQENVTQYGGKRPAVWAC